MGEARAFAVGPGEGETVRGPVGGPLTFKARAADTDGALTAFENVVMPGEGPPVHSHEVESEAWYVVEGALRFRLGAEESEAAAGSFIFVPKGVPHAFTNAGDEPARILVLFTPGGMEGFFDSFAELDTVEPSAFAELGARAGMTVSGPPLGASTPSAQPE